MTYNCPLGKEKFDVIQGNCLDEMAKMESNSIDFIVTDPPYGLYFMGKKWDKETPSVEYWKEALRICKPGSMMAVFGGSRTHHRLMCAIEDAGWEIRDVIMWLYGSGFPKSHNHFGLEGYGTALKPAYEPIVIAMKPLDGTFANNAEKWGLAGININGNRILAIDQKKLSKNWDRETITDIRNGSFGNGIPSGIKLTTHSHNGRWPANIILDEEAGKLLDEQSGNLGISKGGKSGNSKAFMGAFKDDHYGNIKPGFGDTGGASRFFYCAKASSKERNLGCESLPFIDKSNGNKWSDQDYRVIRGERPSSAQSGPRKNFHPTVKPISLMKYIINLLAPPGEPTLLDPFAGSGSTLVAAKELGINAIGIEISEEYCEIARNRIKFEYSKFQ